MYDKNVGLSISASIIPINKYSFPISAEPLIIMICKDVAHIILLLTVQYLCKH